MSDVSSLPNLTRRQEELLAALVRSYTTTPEPVSSKALSLTSDLGLSSATVRNEMAVLEEMGYIRSPHTSAGRIPTEEGYRYFVQHLLDRPRLSSLEIETLRRQFYEVPYEVDKRMQNATVMLAKHTQAAAIVTEPRVLNNLRFKHIQVIGIQGRMALMVLVLGGGNVHQQMLILAEHVPQDLLNQASELLNRLCFDQTAEVIRERIRTLSQALPREIGELAAEALAQMNDLGNRIIYRAGLSDMLPEMEELGAQQVLRLLEETSELNTIISEMQENRIANVEVLIGGEKRWDNLSHLSMILGKYGTEQIVGTIGVVGSTRMRYGKTISAVSFFADLISEFLAELHHEELPNPEQKPPAELSES